MDVAIAIKKNTKAFSVPVTALPFDNCPHHREDGSEHQRTRHFDSFGSPCLRSGHLKRSAS